MFTINFVFTLEKDIYTVYAVFDLSSIFPHRLRSKLIVVGKDLRERRKELGLLLRAAYNLQLQAFSFIAGFFERVYPMSTTFQARALTIS